MKQNKRLILGYIGIPVSIVNQLSTCLQQHTGLNCFEREGVLIGDLGQGIQQSFEELKRGFSTMIYSYLQKLRKRIQFFRYQ